MDFTFNEQLIAEKLKKFSSPTRIAMQHEFFTNSAIVFLIRRAKHQNDKHSGEMSFPGGKYDPIKDATYLNTALRELKEELAIPEKQVKIIGCIDDHLTPKGFIITPFVGYISENQEMIKAENEVKEIVKIPITFFANKNNFKEKTYELSGDLIGVGKFNYRSPDNKLYVIFGATSHIIVNFLDTVYALGLMTLGCRRIRCADIKDRIIK